VGREAVQGRRQGTPLSSPTLPRSTLRAAAAAALGILLLARASDARDDHDPLTGRTSDSLVTPKQAAAIQKGLAWLHARQQSGGMWGDKKDTQIADTALATLALMAGGSTLGPGVPTRDGLVSGPTLRGPYGVDVRNAVDFLAARALADGQFPGYIHGDENSKMHGHGFATLALAIASGGLDASRIDEIRNQLAKGASSKDLCFADRVRLALERAVRLTEKAQDPDTGGWYYAPTPESHEGSMTVTQVVALRAAMEAGVAVNGAVMSRAYDYIRKSQNTTNKELHGGFAYQRTDPNNVRLALTAAALTTFFGLGKYGEIPTDKKLIDDAMRYVDRKWDDDALDTRQQFYYYRLFYLAQALYLSGDEPRQRKYWPQIRDDLTENQQNVDGSFRRDVDSNGTRSDEYCTAMGCLILETPMETLPIFQRR
jgi:hypothetical protein